MIARIAAASVLTLLLFTQAAGQSLPDPIWVDAQLPRYPPLAVQARIEGEVKVTFQLSPDGKPVEVKAVSGHPMLRDATVKNVQSWRFEMPKGLFRTTWAYETVFVYRMSGKEVDDISQVQHTVSYRTFRHIELVSDTVEATYNLY
jgi:TonB family protein